MDFWLPAKPAIIQPAPEVLRPKQGLLLPPRKPMPVRRGMLIATQHIGLGAGGGGAPTTLVQIDSASSNASTITGPATIIAGDVLVALDRALAVGLPTTVLLPGFTQIDERNDLASTRQILSCKVANGSEAGASLTGMNGAVLNRKLLAVFRPDSPASLITPADVAGEQTSGVVAAQTVNAAGVTTLPLIVVAAYGCSDAGTIGSNTFSPAADGSISNNTGSSNIILSWKVYAASPADVTVNMMDEGTENVLQSAYLVIS